MVRERRRRGRAERRRLRQSKRRNRARVRGREIKDATHNVWTMAVDGTHGIEQALYVWSVYDRLGCDSIGLQETCRSGNPAFNQAGYFMYCSCECGGENGGKKRRGGGWLSVRTSITRSARPPELISDRLLKVKLELHGGAKAVTFFAAYAPHETQNAINSNKHEQLYALMDANHRTGRREIGQVGCTGRIILDAYSRDTLNDNGELLLSFANNPDLALVNMLFSTSKGGV